MQRVPRVQGVPGMGLEGDRYFGRGGGAALTLIESEVLEALEIETGVRLDFYRTRRNALTRGISLNALVGKEFTVAGVLVRGIGLCEPCWHVTGGNVEVLRGLVHRGGLRAEIHTAGGIEVGGIIAPVRQVAIGDMVV